MLLISKSVSTLELLLSVYRRRRKFLSCLHRFRTILHSKRSFCECFERNVHSYFILIYWLWNPPKIVCDEIEILMKFIRILNSNKKNHSHFQIQKIRILMKSIRKKKVWCRKMSLCWKDSEIHCDANGIYRVIWSRKCGCV